MRTRLTLRPGQKGTRGLCDQYSERLVCVRYRHDESRNLRFKTVELIVGERPWVYCRPWREIPFCRKVLVATQYGEREFGRALKGAGGVWRPDHQAWEICARLPSGSAWRDSSSLSARRGRGAWAPGDPNRPSIYPWMQDG